MIGRVLLIDIGNLAQAAADATCDALGDVRDSVALNDIEARVAPDDIHRERLVLLDRLVGALDAVRGITAMVRMELADAEKGEAPAAAPALGVQAPSEHMAAPRSDLEDLFSDLGEYARERSSGTIALAISRLRAPRTDHPGRLGAWSAIAKDLAEDLLEAARSSSSRVDAARLLLLVSEQVEASGGAQ